MSAPGFEIIGAVAGGTVHRARFVKLSTAADKTMLECGANAMAVGVSHEAPRDAPLDGADATVIASATQQFDYYPEGRICQIEVGSGGLTAGAQIKSDSDGTAILAATTGAVMQWCNGIALEAANAGELAYILVKIFPIYPALS